MSDARPAWWLPVAGVAGALLIRALGATWRVELADGYAALDARIIGGEPVIYALWHSRLLALTWSHRDRGVGVLISRHRDGELIARMAQRLGFETARGSSTRGGRAGVVEMLALAEARRSLAITPDGPRGPARRIKPGLVYLASRTGWPVVPVTAAAKSAWVFNSWDRFRVPRPFARLRLAYGEPLRVPRDLDEAGEEQWRERIEAALESLTVRHSADVGERA
jgi:lysophospholipid acyltransferase (LPLAT)-like uncharacterized protein